ncbi:hypothetical protein ACOJD8_001269 [Cronobacter turicensis]
MDTENLFFCAGVFVLISIFACVAYVNHNDNATIAGMVKSGADPVPALSLIEQPLQSLSVWVGLIMVFVGLNFLAMEPILFWSNQRRAYGKRY